MKFTEFPFHENILKGIEKAQFTECTPVQAETFKNILEGKDILAQSQTGTGKTAAFLLSIFQMFTQLDKENPRALIIAPTRELADQIEKECQLLGQFTPYSFGSFYGGVGYARQEKLLAEKVNIIIGTPGRLIDFAKSRKIDFGETDILVIDEADRLFDMGFYPDLRWILKKMPEPQERRTLLYSATMNSRVGNIAWEFMNQPSEILIEPEQVTVEAIEQELYHVGVDKKFSLLLGVLKRDQPETAIVFTNTKHQAAKVAKRLEINGYQTEYLIGDLPQRKRLKILDAMKKGNLPILVATDVAARGLHINDLDLVVNYDIPNDSENYVHRIGRTARAGKSGKAISLACEKYVYGLEAIEKYVGLKIPVLWAEEDLFTEDRSAGIRVELEHRGGQRGGRPDNRRGRGGYEVSRGRGSSEGRRSRGGEHREGSRDAKGRRGRDDRPRSRDRSRVQGFVTEVTGNVRSTQAKDSRKDTGRRDKNSKDEKHTAKGLHGKVRKDKGRKEELLKNTGRKSQGKGFKKEKPRENLRNKKGHLEDRIEYYKRKYGEDFIPKEISIHESKKSAEKKGFISRIAGLFKKK